MKYLVVAVLLTSITGYSDEVGFVEGRIASVNHAFSSDGSFSNFPDSGEYIEANSPNIVDKTKLSFVADSSGGPLPETFSSIDNSYFSPSGMWLFGSIALGFFAMWSNRVRSS